MSVESREAVSSADKGAEKLVSFLLLISIVGIPILFIWIYPRAKRLQEELKPVAYNVFETEFGGEPEYIDYFEFAGGFVDAIAQRNNKLGVLQKGTLYVVPISEIRSWKWQIPGIQQAPVVGGIPPDRFKQSVENSRAKQEAVDSSGIFLDIRDVDFPQLQIKTRNKNICMRWHEILNQQKEQQPA